jgi:hypothetical protein
MMSSISSAKDIFEDSENTAAYLGKRDLQMARDLRLLFLQSQKKARELIHLPDLFQTFPFIPR